MELRSLTFPRGPVFDADGELAVGHALACYYPGTDTLRTWYADADLTTPAPNPDLVGSDGRIAQKFLGPGPSEIRQYSPVSPSSVIPDDLQDFPGSEWALEWSWLEDGVSPSPDRAPLIIVDTVDELRALEDEDAKKGLVAVRGYYAAADKIGVRFYQYKSASSPSDDGGAVLGSAMGGRWLLKVQTAADVDVRWWGALPDTAEDRTAAIAAAAAWTSANGVTLYFPKGVYMVSSGSVSFSNVHIASGVTINATAGNYSLTFTGAWRIDQTDAALKDVASTGDVYANFASGADVGIVYMAWNGSDADLTRYPGQNVVLASASAALDNPGGGVELASLTLTKDVNSGLGNPLRIGVLYSNGYTLKDGGLSNITIGQIVRDALNDPVALDWSGSGGALTVLSDFRTSDVSAAALAVLYGNALPQVLTVDADLTLPAGQYAWPKVALRAVDGALLSISPDGGTQPCNKIECFAVEGDQAVFGTGFDYYSWYDTDAGVGHYYMVVAPAVSCLRAVHFDGSTINAAKALAISLNHGGDLRLEGKTVSAFPTTGNYVPTGDLVKSVYGPGTVKMFNPQTSVLFEDCTIECDAVYSITEVFAIFRSCRIVNTLAYGDAGLSLLASASGSFAALNIERCTIDGAIIWTRTDSSPQGACELKIEDSTFVGTPVSISGGVGQVKAANGICWLKGNTFKGVLNRDVADGSFGKLDGKIVLEGWFRDIMIEGNYFEYTTTGTGSRYSPAIKYDDVTTIDHVCIADNSPSRYGSGYYVYWPQTEGAFVDNLSTNQLIAGPFVWNMFKPACDGSAAVTITPHGAHGVEFDTTANGIENIRITKFNVPANPGDSVVVSSSTSSVRIDVVYNLTK